MASYELVLRVIMIWVVLFISSVLAADSYSSSYRVKKALSYDPENVNISVYYQTLSPSCSKFIVSVLSEVFNNDLISIMNLRFVPWGNAKVNPSTKIIICENGQKECLLNTIEACAINIYKSQDMYYGLLSCIELLAVQQQELDWETCFDNLGLPKKPVIDCYNGSSKGTTLELQYGKETANLVPPHTMLPWVVVNQQPIRNDYGNYTKYVCQAYKGPKAPPSACKKFISNSIV